ncbi:MAG: aminomethyl transferase family protein [Bacteroidales bacterium]|nr:aminomethyl transferase family protein [Bacteroidales bacterium]
MRKTPEGYFTVRWGLPEYTDWMDECMSWKTTCYIGDWSFLWEYRFKGKDVLKLFSDISVNSFEKFEIYQAKHVIHTNRDGKVIHEGILARLGEDDFMLFGRGGFWADYNLKKGNYNATSQKEDWFNYQVSGPMSIHVIERAAGKSIRDIKFMHLGRLTIAGREVYAMRQNMAGELGYEIIGPAEYSEEVYNAILEAGKDFGIRKLGGRAVFINHLEACFPTIITDYLPAIFSEDMEEYLELFKKSMPAYAITFNIAGSYEGKELSDYYRSPIELGWSKNIKFDHDFIGRAALEAEMKNPKRTMVTLVWNAEDVIDVYASLFKKGDHYDYMEMPRDQRGFVYFDKVIDKEGKLVGISSSRGYSYYFREMLSLCSIDVELSRPGTEVAVVWGNPGRPQKVIRAVVAPAPYKKDNRKIDVSTLPSYL